EEFFRNQVPSPSTLMARSEVFRKQAFDESLRSGEDLEWILRTAHHYSYQYIDEPLTNYRRHQTNISENLDQLREAELGILHRYGINDSCKSVEESEVDDKPLLKGNILYIMEYF